MKYIFNIIIGLLFSVNVFSQFIATSFSSGGDEPSLLLDSLFAYYPLEEASGSIIDAHGSNNLSVNGSLVYQETGIIAYCDTFATDAYTTGVADNFDFPGDFSISLWALFSTTGAYGQLINNYAQPIQFGDSYGWDLEHDNGGVGAAVLKWNIRHTSTSTTITGTTVVNDNAWHHVVVSYSAADDSIKLWVDGDIDAWVDAGAGPDYHADNLMQIGVRSSFYPSYYEGKLDEIAIYRGLELSHGKIDSLYNEGNSLAYPLDF